MGAPLVSVIMANYNTNEEYLAQSISSILAQSYRNFEFIIIDDASTNDNAELIKSFDDNRIIFVQNEANSGISHTVNRGLNMARGKYIARMDSDDIAHWQRLEKQVAYLEQHEEIDVLAARAQNFGAKKGLFACLETNPKRIHVLLFFGCIINNPSTMFRYELIRKNNILYDTGYFNGEDYLFWSRCAHCGNISEYQSVLLYYRRHERQISIYDRQQQIRMANQVRMLWLEELYITPTQAELWMHYGLCIGSYLHQDIPKEYRFTIDSLSAWCVRLCEANNIYGCFPKKIFMKEIASRYMLVTMKAFRAGDLTIRQVMTYLFSKKYLPSHAFVAFANYIIVNIRVNQRFTRPEKPPLP